jgi:hypothetical protein
MIIVPAALFMVGWDINEIITRAITHSGKAIIDWQELCIIICYLMIFLACPISLLKSPRHGRYMFALALFVGATSYTLTFSVSVYSAIHSDCINCYTFSDDLNKGSVLQKIFAQPTHFIIFWVALFCVLFRQQYIVRAVLLLLIMLSIPSVVFWAQGLVALGSVYSYLVIIGVYVFLKILQFIGNRRARSILDLNRAATETLYNELCQSFPIFGSFSSCKHEHTTHCCLAVKHRRDSLGTPLLAPDFASSDAPHTLVSPSSTQSERVFDIDSFFQMENIGQQQLRQQHDSFESLIRDAEFVNCAFQEWASSWLSNGPGLDKIQRFLYHSADGIDSSLSNLSSKAAELPINGTHIRGPVKHVDRSIEKVPVTKLALFHCSTIPKLSKLACQRISCALAHVLVVTSARRCIAHTVETSENCVTLCGAA